MACKSYWDELVGRWPDWLVRMGGWEDYMEWAKGYEGARFYGANECEDRFARSIATLLRTRQLV
jgi:hypothetical protein